uniref:Uncharacterized protein n=1 Tax=Rhizophora mucronata TaxID=61149 RepID=A0A2P2QXG3_RHIMU
MGGHQAAGEGERASWARSLPSPPPSRQW